MCTAGLPGQEKSGGDTTEHAPGPFLPGLWEVAYFVLRVEILMFSCELCSELSINSAILPEHSCGRAVISRGSGRLRPAGVALLGCCSLHGPALCTPACGHHASPCVPSIIIPSLQVETLGLPCQ